jgi:hypothetical protein
MSIRWLPELPGHGGAYASCEWPESGVGVLYPTVHPITRDPWYARWFSSQEACEAWIAVHPHLGFQAIEHLFFDGEHA